VGAAAGIAIVKPHFPFYRAYELSTSLTDSAKLAKKHCESATSLDFEVVFDSATTDVTAIRERQEPAKNIHLTFRPYIVSVPAGDSSPWLKARDMSELRKRAKALGLQRGSRDVADNEPTLPRTQQHLLRNSLSLGPNIVEARLDEIYNRYSALQTIAP
jgi:hypothetical protein